MISIQRYYKTALKAQSGFLKEQVLFGEVRIEFLDASAGYAVKGIEISVPHLCMYDRSGYGVQIVFNINLAAPFLYSFFAAHLRRMILLA